MSTTDQQAVTVAQEDREAAADWVRVGYPSKNAIDFAGSIMGGLADWGSLVQAFARHRLAPVSSASADPVAWCSPGQLANLMDVDVDGGVYLPIRKTERGNFTMPLYAASPEPVPATNQAGEVEDAPAYSFDINADLETEEAEARAIEKDPFDWPGATGFYMGLFERRDQSEFKMRAGLWDADGMSQNWPEVPNLRNRAALATQPATSQEGEALAERLRNRIEENPMMAVRDRKLMLEAATSLAATPTPPTLSEDLRVLVEALRPLADLYLTGSEPDDECAIDASDFPNAGHVRAARAALAQVKAS